MLLRKLGAEIVLARRFADHHLYAPGEIISLAHAAGKAGAEFIVTTRKDAVKIPRELAAGISLPLMCLDVSLELVEGEDLFVSLLLEAMEKFRASMGMENA